MKDLLLFGPEKWSFVSGSDPKLVRFWRRPFFSGDYLILTEKPPHSDSRLTKIWVKFVYYCFQLPKKPPPPPLRIPGYAPGRIISGMRFTFIKKKIHMIFEQLLTEYVLPIQKKQLL